MATTTRNDAAAGAASGGAAGGAYALGFIGALVYWLQTATSFWDGAFGVVQALFWPAFLVYEALSSFDA